MSELPPTGTERARSRFRLTLSDDGRPGPIEERLGRRLLRLVEPESAEGRRLLESASVEVIAPGGESWGRMPPSEAYRRLRARLERRLADPAACEDREATQEGLHRLEMWSGRVNPTREPAARNAARSPSE